ncbi:MAG: RpiB/LacA/LacB family sugar-phosphate isomerase [Zetaproteobacteria bacterium]|nr:RpiB/LacA/LacB family sugar-phosphate isomerase [Zetaproteobacteria bacterium]
MNQFSKVGIVADHAGFAVVKVVLSVLDRLQVKHIYYGVHNSDRSVDYPSVFAPLGQAWAAGEVDGGIAVCGSGVGMSIVANKYSGLRSASVWNETVCKLAREHNDLNLLCLGARVLEPSELTRIIELWLTTPFEGGRHQRRVELIHSLEDQS